MLDLMMFDIKENYIAARNGSFYFYNVHPPNFSTLDMEEQELHFRNFEKLMRATTEHDFFICAMDKTVSLTQNRDYIMTLSDKYSAVKDALMDTLDNLESSKGNTQRGYYFGLFCRQHEEAAHFESLLHTMGVDIVAADRNELILIMRSFNLREFVDYDIMISPDEPPFLYGKKKIEVSPLVKHLLPTAISFNHSTDVVVQTNFLRKTLVVRNLPQRIERHNRDIFKKLFQLPNTTVMMRISDMDYSETRTLVNRQFNNSQSQRARSKISDVIDADADAKNIVAFWQDIQATASEGGSMKRVNIYVETYGSDRTELQENIRRIRTTCETYGMTWEDYILHQEDGFWGVSPIGYDTRGKLLANNIPSGTLGRLYPFSSSAINDATGMLLGHTVDNGMVSVDIWGRTLWRTNSNIVIIGDSGMGKSHLIKKIISQQRPLGTTMWILDSEDEYSFEVRQLGGKVINCSSSGFAINPLQIRQFKSDADVGIQLVEDEGSTAFSEETPFFQHLSWLKDFLSILLPGITPLQVAAFSKILRDVYKKHGIDERTSFDTISNDQYPLFSDVYGYIEDVLKCPKSYPFYNMIDERDLKALLLLLDDVCFGSLSTQFNHYTNATDNSLVNLNIQGLLMGSQDSMQATLFNYLTYLWGKVIERNGRILLILDELYLLANENNPIILRYLNSFERRSRKYDAGLLIATQKVMDCLHDRISQWTSAIFDTPTYKFLFYPGDVDLDVMRVKLRLTAGEIEGISLPERKKCLLKVGKDKYQMTVGTLSYELDMFGQGGGQ